MTRAAFEVFTLKERPDLAEQVHRLNGESWPTFLLHANLPHWGSLFDEFVEGQIRFCEPACHADPLLLYPSKMKNMVSSSMFDLVCGGMQNGFSARIQ